MDLEEITWEWQAIEDGSTHHKYFKLDYWRKLLLWLLLVEESLTLSSSKIAALKMEGLYDSLHIHKVDAVGMPILQNGKQRSGRLTAKKWITPRLECFRDSGTQSPWCFFQITEVPRLGATCLRSHTIPQQCQGSAPESAVFPIHQSFLIPSTPALIQLKSYRASFREIEFP